MYKFKSRAAGDLIMLEPNGRQILTIIGKYHGPADSKGILLPEQMPAAIAALEAAVAQDEARQAELARDAKAEGKEPPKSEGISLRQRALPFIEMIRRCQKAEMEIVWGV
ncbi:MAG: DUF1840 domain-containing protein [Burkholderiales bacterium]|nr:DUF1840 domain-containing protein [Burkholderiales bacterium]